MLTFIETIIERFILENPTALAYILLGSLILCVVFQLIFVLKTRKKAGKSKLRKFIWIYILLLYLAMIYYLTGVGTADSAAIISHEMRNDILIPVADFALSEEDEAEDLLSTPEDAYILWIDDLEDYFSPTILCQVLKTCYEGYLINISDTTISINSWIPLISLDEDTSLICELDESGDFLTCLEDVPIECEDFYLVGVDSTQFFAIQEKITVIMTEETIVEIWLTDGFGELIVVNTTWHDLPLYEDLIRIYPLEIDGELFAEKVIIYRFIWEEEDELFFDYEGEVIGIEDEEVDVIEEGG